MSRLGDLKIMNKFNLLIDIWGRLARIVLIVSEFFLCPYESLCEKVIEHHHY